VGTLKVHASTAKRHLKHLARWAWVRGHQILGTGRSVRRVSGLRILTYHRVANAPDDPFCVEPTAFRRQMELVSLTGVVASFDQALADLKVGHDPRPRIALTFDDGTEDFMSGVLPLLVRLRLPAVLYVTPARVGSAGFLGWAEVAEASRAGVTVGSHGMDHRSLGKLRPQESERQVVESKRILEDRLGLQVTSLAYPFGTLRDFNSGLKRAIEKAGYRSACTSLNGLNRSDTDLYELRRTKIEQGDDAIFKRIVEGHLDGWFLVDRYLSFLQSRYD